MKRIIVFLIGILLAVTLTAQNKYTYPIYVGKVTVSTGKIFLYGITSGTLELRPPSIAGTGTVFQFPSSNGANGNVLTTNGSGVTSWSAAGTGTIDTTFIYAEIDSLDQRLTDIENDTILGSSLYPELADTIPLVSFGIGSGVTADTACFNNGRLIGAFYNEGSDTLAVTQLMGILKEGTGTETIAVQISWHATFLSGSATSLNATALAITSMTTGTADVSFANSKIPPNVFVWGILSGASANNKPTYLSVTLSGYKIPTY